MVTRIANVDLTRAVDRYTSWRIKACVDSGAVRGARAESQTAKSGNNASGRDFTDSIIAGIGDKNIPRLIDGYSERTVKPSCRPGAISAAKKAGRVRGFLG